MNEINKDDKCRTCLKITTKMISLDTKLKMLNVEKTYMDLLKYIAKLEVEAEIECKASQRICSICSKKMRDSYSFIEQIHKSYKFFLSLADNHCTKDKANEALQENPRVKEELIIDEPTKRETSTVTTEQNNNSHELKNLDNVSVELIKDALDVDKMFSINKEYINPRSIINNIEIVENTAISSNESSYEDPLDNDANDGSAASDSVEDEMLPVRCDVCERVFADSFKLNRHKKDTHLPQELKIQCPKCPVKFSRRYNMYAHMRTFHKAETVREHQLQPRKLTKTDVCDQCQRSYSDKYKLMAHIKNKHGPNSVAKKPKQPPKQYLCTLCGLTCTNKSNLEIHYRRRHTGEKPFKCDFCERCFTRSYEVKVHRRTHTGEAPYICTVCEKAFKRSNKLKIHMRIHTNERPYKCTECEKAFRESKDLNIHKRTHTGERPYKCGVCNSTFTQSNSLRLHQKNKKHFTDTLTNNDVNHVVNPLP